eukprot:TRINITY_DN1686_c0_g1_i1.p1 TRINITY_DN1686_c0_g1~~TRINITY_DN1686_c0_g1_i1.p1  ORF type:complete len:434 (+),score=53.92 TRINITY_DN1686_c0_g1_i1:144-1445(+)
MPHTDSLIPTTQTEYNMKGFVHSMAVIITVLVTAVFIFCDYGQTDVDTVYFWYIHVAVMIFVGFGFLMTFLKRYAFGAVGLNFLASCVMMVEAIVLVGLFSNGVGFQSVKVDLQLVTEGAFCAGAGMITFGAILGKVSPKQLVWLLVWEAVVYTFNAWIIGAFTSDFSGSLKALDIGGSLSIHTFGAYFGLTATLFLSKKGCGSEHPKNGSVYISDVTAMIGTIFLWIFWPSFNGAVATTGDERFYATINTVMSLLGACISTFMVSAYMDGKLNMVHIQNATLAGGVAMGSSANLNMLPGAALLIGVAAGILSTVGYVRISPYLENTIGLKDTCGVHNLHGMPGVLGGIIAAFVSVLAYDKNSDLLDSISFGENTWWHQLLALGCTLAFAIVGGGLGGFFVQMLEFGVDASTVAYEDAAVWDMEQEDIEEAHL